jgi:hypothetical protein
MGLLGALARQTFVKGKALQLKRNYPDAWDLGVRIANQERDKATARGEYLYGDLIKVQQLHNEMIDALMLQSHIEGRPMHENVWQAVGWGFLHTLLPT